MPFKDAEQRKRYQKEWIAKRRADWFADKRCQWCGGTKDLQLDHLDPKTKVDHRIWSWSERRRLVELEKCRVLCVPCHSDKTWLLDGRKRAEHGGAGMYETYNCRCAKCREYKRALNARRIR